MTPERQQDLDQLLSALCDDTASPEQIDHLEELLRSDAECRTFYLRYVDLHARLMQHPGFRPTLPADSGCPKCLDGPPPAVPVSPVLGFLGDIGRQGCGYISDHTMLFSVLAALVLVVATVTLAVRNFSLGRQDTAAKSEIADHKNAAEPQPSIPAHSAEAFSPSPCSSLPARLVRVKDCHWNGKFSAPVVGQELPAGQSLSLASGVAEIEFDIGAKVILQSPASFQLLAANAARLEMGKATVEIKNERARGFKIVTPETTFIDQGTEFGVEVTPGGSSKVHVFRGLVDVDHKARNGQQNVPLIHRLVANVGARMESGEEGMTLVQDTGECFIRSMDEADRDRHVVAYWRFEDRPLGTVLPHTDANRNPVRATTDSSFNGNDLFVYESPYQQPRIIGDVPAGAVPQSGAANRGCLENSIPPSHPGHSDLYTRSQFSHAAPLDIQTIAPAQWTIEVSVKARSLDSPAGVAIYGKEQTFVGRDGCRQSVLPQTRDWLSPRLAFEITADYRFAISFADPQNRFHQAAAEQLAIEPGRWYNLAATSDGRTLRLYADVNDGQGYRLQAETALPTTGSTALACGSSDGEWSIGRGRDRVLGGPGQFFNGWIDEVRISDIARDPAEFLFTPRNQTKEKGIEKSVP